MTENRVKTINFKAMMQKVKETQEQKEFAKKCRESNIYKDLTPDDICKLFS